MIGDYVVRFEDFMKSNCARMCCMFPVQVWFSLMTNEVNSYQLNEFINRQLC